MQTAFCGCIINSMKPEASQGGLVMGGRGSRAPVRQTMEDLAKTITFQFGWCQNQSRGPIPKAPKSQPLAAEQLLIENCWQTAGKSENQGIGDGCMLHVAKNIYAFKQCQMSTINKKSWLSQPYDMVRNFNKLLNSWRINQWDAEDGFQIL